MRDAPLGSRAGAEDDDARSVARRFRSERRMRLGGFKHRGRLPEKRERTRDRREIAIQIQTVTLKPKSQLRSMASLMDRVKKRVSPMKFDRHTLSKTFTYLYYVSPLASPPL